MSVAPLEADALQTTATNEPSAAMVGVAFTRPGTLSETATASVINSVIAPPIRNDRPQPRKRLRQPSHAGSRCAGRTTPAGRRGAFTTAPHLACHVGQISTRIVGIMGSRLRIQPIHLL